jgi:hypothetical protein
MGFSDNADNAKSAKVRLPDCPQTVCDGPSREIPAVVVANRGVLPRSLRIEFLGDSMM